jgi:1-acyl-sn-glycerol-3-phosphate acyltransferase
MNDPFLYQAIRALARAVLAVYFKSVDVVGEENVPASGPVIVASNHPQSVTDAVVLAAVVPRVVRYLAHGGLFRNRVRAWLFRACGVIPVYRPRDAANASERNLETFADCARVLENGGAIGIFPEGESTEDRRVKKLKTGAARIALETETKNDWRLGVKIVPVGLSFESRRRMRTRVLVSFGAPMGTEPHRDRYRDDPVGTVRGLSASLQDAMRRLVVDIERPEYENLVRGVEMIYKDEVLTRRDLEVPGRTEFERQQIVAREIPRALDHFLENRPEVVLRVQRMLEGYRDALERTRIRDDMLRDEIDRTIGGETARILALGGAGLPLAVWGALWSFVPFELTRVLAGRAARDETKIHYFQIAFGILLFSLWYVPLVFCAHRVVGPWAAGVFAVMLVPSGLFARAYVRWIVRHARTLKFARIAMTHRRLVQDLRRRRTRFVAEIDAALSDYLRSQEAPASSAPLRKEGPGE